MPPFTRILCPVDFDQGSLAAVPYAAELADKHNAILFLLHVIQMHSAAEPAMSFAEAEAKAHAKLEQISHRKLKAETSYELHMLTGNAAVEILQAATRLGVDLIVMATHGRTGLRRLALGSVAERVVREAPCPVLTIRPKARSGGTARK